MNIRIEELSKISGLSKDSVRIYMCRNEFCHIPLKKGVYLGITDEDIVKLRQMFEYRKYRGRNVI